NNAPVIVMLDEITLGKSLAIETSKAVQVREPGYTDRGNREVTGLVLHSLNAILGKDGFVQSCGTERVHVVDLKGAFPVAVCRRKLRDRGSATKIKCGTKEAAVDSIILEIFINANEILVAVAEIA